LPRDEDEVYQEKEQNGFKYILKGGQLEFLKGNRHELINCKDKRLWALCITSCCFEGSMYLWIFFKFPALKLAHKEAGQDSDLPFGIIFAALMCAMMLGSQFFTSYTALKLPVSSTMLLTVTLTIASFCFIVPVLTHSEPLTFWCFCMFEICCGIYFPSMAHLKEKIIDDGVRAKIYGIMRIPLNVFVVVGLMLTPDGMKVLPPKKRG
jgi:hypothetical protein